MFTSVYRPKSCQEFIGNQNVIQPFIQWLLKWEWTNKKNKCALVYGLTGIGKSLLVELILQKFDYHIIEIALDEQRDKDYMTNVITPILNATKTFDGQDNILVVSDIDAGSDYGFISSLTECIKVSRIPIVCICDNRYDQGIKSVLPYCLDFKMSKPTYNEVYGLLYNVVMSEKIKVKEVYLKELYEHSNGDMRFMLNTLQFGLRKDKKNIQSSNIFETSGKLMSMDETLDVKYETYWLGNDLHSLMIQENYINNIMGANASSPRIALNNLAHSANALSDMDLFESYVNMANWEFEPYVAISTINAASKCNKKTMIKFPQFLGRTSAMYKNRRDKLNYEKVAFFEKKVDIEKTLKKTSKKTEKVEKKKEIIEKEKKPRGRPKKTI